MTVKSLLIDNYDSFTFNLYQLIAEVNGVAPEVVRNDEVGWSDLANSGFDNIVVSPGPGRPQRAADVGLSMAAIRHSRVPLLGVCLGHQGIGHAFGATVGHAPEPVHGRLAKVHHAGDGLFAGIPSPFTAVRYHSLAVCDLPPVLRRSAWCDDGLVMGLRHRTRPLWGVQFHPESICTEHGATLLDNFRQLTERWHGGRRRSAQPRSAQPRSAIPVPAPDPRLALDEQRFRVHVLELDVPVDAEQAYLELFAGAERSFWLDGCAQTAGSRFSYLGDDTGPHAEYVTHDVERGTVLVESQGRSDCQQLPFLDYLDAQLHRRQLDSPTVTWDFDLGYVGFLGYELKAECGGRGSHPAPTPDAAMLFADRMLVVNHSAGPAFLVALSQPATRQQAERWLDQTQQRLRLLVEQPPLPPRTSATTSAATPASTASPATAATPGSGASPAWRFRHDAGTYRRLVAACQREIRDGESYELCLTNAITADVRVDPVQAYRHLRHANPAPYAALLRFGELSVLSSSPERFLHIDRRGAVESKPIKGTRRRAATRADDLAARDALANSEKDLAENLMIVDLLRNDLGRVCEVGSVAVPQLFAVETYATVHQLVSTVRGRLRSDRTPVDCVRAAFPGGSMTGAPKRRSMEILARLEAGPRGVYAGALGFFGLGGSVDLSIVIRTVVVTPDTVSVGTGGAVVALSDPQDELNETLLKAEPMLAAVASCLAEQQVEGLVTLS
jgi:para-aminobenzoate synthetase